MEAGCLGLKEVATILSCKTKNVGTGSRVSIELKEVDLVSQYKIKNVIGTESKFIFQSDLESRSGLAPRPFFRLKKPKRLSS